MRRSRFLLHGMRLILMLRLLPFRFLLAWLVACLDASPVVFPFLDAWPAAPPGPHPIVYLLTLILRCRPPACAPRPRTLLSLSQPLYHGAGLTPMHQGFSPHLRLHGNACSTYIRRAGGPPSQRAIIPRVLKLVPHPGSSAPLPRGLAIAPLILVALLNTLGLPHCCLSLGAFNFTRTLLSLCHPHGRAPGSLSIPRTVHSSIASSP